MRKTTKSPGEKIAKDIKRATAPVTCTEIKLCRALISLLRLPPKLRLD